MCTSRITVLNYGTGHKGFQVALLANINIAIPMETISIEKTPNVSLV